LGKKKVNKVFLGGESQTVSNRNCGRGIRGKENNVHLGDKGPGQRVTRTEKIWEEKVLKANPAKKGVKKKNVKSSHQMGKKSPEKLSRGKKEKLYYPRASRIKRKRKVKYRSRIETRD